MSNRFAAGGLLLAMALRASAQAADPLRGHWALQVEGRNLIVLHLAGARPAMTGSMEWPHSTMSFNSSGMVVSQVAPPVRTGTVSELRAIAAGRVFVASDPQGDSPEFALRPDGRGGLLFSAVGPGFESAPVRMVAVAADAHVAADWDPAGSWQIRSPPEPPNQELASLFEADQADRAGGPDVDWSVVAPRDKERRARVRAMLDAGLLRAADDYYRAAFIFQHGDEPRDYLLAHVLAMASQTLGRADASWIAAATLDRYLRSIEQTPVFGTGFTPHPDGSVTVDPFDRELVPDSVRKLLGVATGGQLEQQLRQLERARD